MPLWLNMWLYICVTCKECVPDVHLLSWTKSHFGHVPGQTELNTVVSMCSHRTAHCQCSRHLLPFLCGGAGALRRVQLPVCNEVTPQSAAGALRTKCSLMADFSVRLKHTQKAINDGTVWSKQSALPFVLPLSALHINTQNALVVSLVRLYSK